MFDYKWRCIIIFSGIITAAGLVAIAAKFSKGFLQKLLGYEWIVDLVITLGLPILFMGTYSGMISAVVTGLSISLILWVSGNIIGRQKYQLVTDEEGNSSREWVYTEGAWTIKSIASKMSHAIRSDISGCIGDFKEGWRNDKQVNQSA